MRFFQRTLMGFNNLSIHFFFFLESLIVCLWLKYLVQSSKWRVELVWEVVFFAVPEQIVQVWRINFWLRGFGIRLSFYLSKRASFCSRYGFFTIPSLILSHLELSRIELPNLTLSIFMEILQRLGFLKSLSLSQMHLHIV